MQTLQKLMERLMKDTNHQATFEQTVQRILHFPAIQQFVEENQAHISSEMISNSLSKLNEYMLEVEALERGEQGKNPGFVPKLYINYNFIDVTYVPTAEYIERRNQQQRAALLDNRMMSVDVRQASIQHYDLNSVERQALMKEVTAFINLYQQNPHQAQGLYITGPFGVGKTYLLGALANYLVTQGHSVTMLHYPTFTTEIKQTIAHNTTSEFMDRIKRVDILMLDDIGAEANSAWLRDEVLTILLEYRMKESLPTFFTSNFNMEELAMHLAGTKDMNDSLKSQRLMERIRFLAKEVHLNGENRRHRNRN